MSGLTLDNEEFESHQHNEHCPVCQQPMNLVELGSHLIPTRLLENLLDGVKMLKECLRCKAHLSTN